MSWQYLVYIILGCWLFVLTVSLAFFYNFFRRFTKGAKEQDLTKVLEKILSTQDFNTEETRRLKIKLDQLEEDALFHIQKVELLKFNPFKEIGGEHSFTLAFLNKKGSGVIVTGLHTRESTRIYAKTVENGKSEVTLSGEEERVLTRALK
jgi:hypothetical protein